MPFGKAVAIPFEIVPYLGADSREEGIESPHFLGEQMRIIVGAGLQLLSAGRVVVQRQSGERQIHADGDDRPEDIEQLDGGNLGAEQFAVQVSVHGDDVGGTLVAHDQVGGSESFGSHR